MTYSTKLVSVSQPTIDGVKTAEELVVYCARVSNPSNQVNMETAPKLLKYLLTHKHVSPFEMVSVGFEIKTSRAIAAQILRHRSFSFQEFSQRYAKATEVLVYPARRQDLKNKQNSIDDMDSLDKEWFELAQHRVSAHAKAVYQEALDRGIAKEQARMILPLGTETTLYMSGTLRSWIHYCDVRCDVSTQLEHREIALSIREQLKKEFPNVGEALNW
jgi:thymidylate synthase (FAD)